MEERNEKRQPLLIIIPCIRQQRKVSNFKCVFQVLWFQKTATMNILQIQPTFNWANFATEISITVNFQLAP